MAIRHSSVTQKQCAVDRSPLQPHSDRKFSQISRKSVLHIPNYYSNEDDTYRAFGNRDGNPAAIVLVAPASRKSPVDLRWIDIELLQRNSHFRRIANNSPYEFVSVYFYLTTPCFLHTKHGLMFRAVCSLREAPQHPF